MLVPSREILNTICEKIIIWLLLAGDTTTDERGDSLISDYKKNTSLQGILLY